MSTQHVTHPLPEPFRLGFDSSSVPCKNTPEAVLSSLPPVPGLPVRALAAANRETVCSHLNDAAGKLTSDAYGGYPAELRVTLRQAASRVADCIGGCSCEYTEWNDVAMPRLDAALATLGPRVWSVREPGAPNGCEDRSDIAGIFTVGNLLSRLKGGLGSVWVRVRIIWDGATLDISFSRNDETSAAVLVATPLSTSQAQAWAIWRYSTLEHSSPVVPLAGQVLNLDQQALTWAMSIWPQEAEPAFSLPELVDAALSYGLENLHTLDTATTARLVHSWKLDADAMIAACAALSAQPTVSAVSC